MSSKPSTLAKYWVTEAGLQAAIIFTRQKFYCGYVGVPKEHPLFEVPYGSDTPYLPKFGEDEMVGQRGVISLICSGDRLQSPELVFDVHGSLTFSNKWDKGDIPELVDGLWYFGYDCAHAGDGEFPDVDGEGNIINDRLGFSYVSMDQPKSLEFNIEQCESLAAQIVEKTLPMLAIEDKSNEPK